MTHEFIRELGSRDDAEALKALADTAEVDDAFLRRTAVETIGRHPRGHELAAIILRAFRDPSDYVVRTACEVVAGWELSEAHSFIEPLLANASKATRESAIRALGAVWVETDFPLIFSIYAEDSDIHVRREAALVLRRRATFANWRTLFDVFSVDALPRHRQWACELAENFAGPDTLPVLSRLATDSDGHVRKAALRAERAISRRG